MVPAIPGPGVTVESYRGHGRPVSGPRRVRRPGLSPQIRRRSAIQLLDQTPHAQLSEPEFPHLSQNPDYLLPRSWIQTCRDGSGQASDVAVGVGMPDEGQRGKRQMGFLEALTTGAVPADHGSDTWSSVLAVTQQGFPPALNERKGLQQIQAGPGAAVPFQGEDGQTGAEDGAANCRLLLFIGVPASAVEAGCRGASGRRLSAEVFLRIVATRPDLRPVLSQIACAEVWRDLFRQILKRLW